MFVLRPCNVRGQEASAKINIAKVAAETFKHASSFQSTCRVVYVRGKRSLAQVTLYTPSTVFTLPE